MELTSFFFDLYKFVKYGHYPLTWVLLLLVSAVTVSRAFVDAGAANLNEFQGWDLRQEVLVAVFLTGRCSRAATLVVAMEVWATGENRPGRERLRLSLPQILLLWCDSQDHNTPSTTAIGAAVS